MDTEIFQELVLEHYRNPRCRVEGKDDETFRTLNNPNCGDVIRIRFSEDLNGRIQCDHCTEGCAASVASSSMMCEMLSNLEPSEVRSKIEAFLESMKGSAQAVEPVLDASIEWSCLLEFRKHPARALCVMLPWECARNALADLSLRD